MWWFAFFFCFWGGGGPAWGSLRWTTTVYVPVASEGENNRSVGFLSLSLFFDDRHEWTHPHAIQYLSTHIRFKYFACFESTFILLNLSIQKTTWYKHTVDGQNPAPPRMMIIPLFNIIYRVLTIPGGCLGFRPSTVSYKNTPHVDVAEHGSRLPACFNRLDWGTTVLAEEQRGRHFFQPFFAWEEDRFLLIKGLFSGVKTVSFRESTWCTWLDDYDIISKKWMMCWWYCRWPVM